MQIEMFPRAMQPTAGVPEKRYDRLFIALFPDPATAFRIDRLARAFHRDNRLDRTPQAVTRQHVSVLKIGDFRRLQEKHLYAARLAAQRVEMAAFAISLDAIGSFVAAPAAVAPPRRPLVLLGTGPEIVELSNQLRVALGRKPLSPYAEVRPHLTLSYGPEVIPFQPIAPIRFVAHELVLVHSEVGRTRYHLRGRWSLQG